MDPSTAETQLIQEAAAGDADAFTLLFQRYYAMIHAFAYRLSLDPAEAEDIAQETFIRAARALDRFVDAGTAHGFRAWLYRIALNLVRDGARRRRRETALQAEIRWREDQPVRPEAPLDTPLTTALGELPTDLRHTLVLVFYEGMNHAEAARAIGCAETTVSWRIFQAKRRLRKALFSIRRPEGRP